VLTVDKHLVRLINRGRVIGALPEFSDLSFTREDMARGAWTLETSMEDHRDVLSEWLDSPYPVIEVWSVESDARALGLIEDYTLTQTPAGQRLRAAGFDWMGVLEDSLVWPTPNAALDLADFWQFDGFSRVRPVETTAAEWVAQVAFSSLYGGAFERDLIWSSLPTADPPETTAPVAAFGGAAPTLQRIRELLTGTDYTVTMGFELFDDTGGVLARPGVIERPRSNRLLSVEEGTLGEVATTVRAASATRVIGVGAEIGGGPDREVVSSEALLPANWQRRYVERFISEPNRTGADLLEECRAELAKAGPSRSVVAVDPRAGIWGADLDVGWIASVAVRDHRGVSETLELPVIASTITADRRGHRRVIELGAAERRDIAGLIAQVGELRREVARLRGRI